MNMATCRKLRDILSITLAAAKDKGIDVNIAITEYAASVDITISVKK